MKSFEPETVSFYSIILVNIITFSDKKNCAILLYSMITMKDCYMTSMLTFNRCELFRNVMNVFHVTLSDNELISSDMNNIKNFLTS